MKEIKKIVCIGDLHGRDCWKQIVEQEKDADLFVFVGDYFDTYLPIGHSEQIFNFEEIVRFKNKFKKVVMLIGNHDYHYFPEIGYNGTSGYQAGPAALNIGYTLNKHRKHLRMAYMKDGILFTHAGVTRTFLNRVGYKGTKIDRFINNLWKYKPLVFNFYGFDPYGDNVTQTPIWVRPESLMRDAKGLVPVQVVGHTGQKKIDIEGKATGKKFFFIDTLGHEARQYLIIDNGEFKLGKF